MLARVQSEMKRKISEMKQHVNSKETSMAICLSPFNLPTCDPDNVYTVCVSRINFTVVLCLVRQFMK